MVVTRALLAGPKRFWTRSIRRQLILGVALVHAVLMTIFVVDLVLQQRSFLHERRLGQTTSLARMLAANSSSWVLADDVVGLAEIVEAQAAYPYLRYAMVLTPNGRVLAHSDATAVGLYVADPISRRLLGAYPTIQELVDTDAALDVAAPILANGQLIGWARVSLSTADVLDSLEAATWDGILYTLLAIAVGTMLASLMAHHLMRGLRNLSEVSRRFRQGEREVRADRARLDEIGDVGRGMNDMLESIVESEQALRDRERQLLEAQTIAQLGRWRWTVATEQMTWSEQMYRTFGCDKAAHAPTFKSFVPMVHSDDRQPLLDALNRAVEDQASFEREFRVTRPSGDERVCWAEGRYEHAEGASTLHGICQDITERRATEQQLRQAQKMEAVGQLTGGIAHDFNNLLTVVLGNLQLLERTLRADERNHRRIRTAIEAVERGAELTRRLLAFSRRQRLEPKVVDANALLSGMDDLLHRALGEEVELEVARAGDLWLTKADQSQLETAILNLAINARDAMPGGGKLTVETANTHLDSEYASLHVEVTPGEYVLVAVSDTGTGIPKDVIDKVFQPFFTTKEPGKGTGLGLSMVHGFVKQSGGHIKVYSEPGCGTTVKIYLPREKVSALEDSGPTLEAVALASGQETILVVEDDAKVREIAVSLLRELGYRVLEAVDGPSALAVIEGEEAIDLLFSDIIMSGGMNGLELAQRARRRRPDLKVLHTSGYAEAAVARGSGLAADCLIGKPYRKEDLARKVRHALDG
jgi:signal transduction histidine kinase